LALFYGFVRLLTFNVETAPEEKCQTNHINEPRNSTNKLRTPIVLQQSVTERATISAGTSTPGKRWSTPIKRSAGQKTLIRNQRTL
jgi:hypothetical protein